MNYDLEKLKKSIIYINRMANGNNPMNNQKIENNSIFNNPNFIRCMYFIKDILEDVYKNKGIIGKNNKRIIIKEPYPLELLNKFEYKEDCTITNFIKQINDLAYELDVEKIKRTDILKWLKNNNYISTEIVEGFTSNSSVVTELGKNIGMYNEVKNKREGCTYLAVLYSKDAQEFIVNNMEIILKESN